MLALHIADQCIGVAQLGAGGQLHRQVEAILCELRDQIHAQGRNQRQRERKCRRRTAEHQPGPRQCRRQDPRVGFGRHVVTGHQLPTEPAKGASHRGAQAASQQRDRPGDRKHHATEHLAQQPTDPTHAALDRAQHRVPGHAGGTIRLGLQYEPEWRGSAQRTEHRNQGQRNQQRDDHGYRNGQGLIAEQLSRHTLDEHQRQEYRHRGQRGRDHRHADFLRALHRRIQQAEAALACLGDAFQHHDRVVYHHAGCERQTGQRHHVEIDAEPAHHEKRGDDRNRQRQADHERAPAIAQEEKDQQDRQRATQQCLRADLVEGLADEYGLIVHLGQFGARRNVGFELFQRCLDAIRHIHRVGIAFLVDRQFDRFAAIQPDDRLALLEALADRGDVAQVDRVAIAIHHQQIAHLLEIDKLVDGAHQIALRALFQAAAGNIDVLLAQSIDHRADRQVQARERLLIEIDLNLVLEATGNLDRGDAGDRFQPFLEFFLAVPAQALEQCFIDTRDAAFAAQGKAHDRLGGRVETQQHRFFRFKRQLHRFQFVAHLDARLVHVGTPGELQNHVALPGTRHRMQLAQVLDHAHRFLDRLGHQVFDLAGRSANVLGAHGQRGIAQVRQQIDLELTQRQQAEQHQGHGKHRHRDPAAGGKGDQAHWLAAVAALPLTATALAASGSLTTSTVAPSRNVTLPTVTTPSPSTNPSRISA